jgi:hypothetical protein
VSSPLRIGDARPRRRPAQHAPTASAGGAAVLATCATCTEATRPLEAWVLTGSGIGIGTGAPAPSARTATALRRPQTAERRLSGTATAAP